VSAYALNEMHNKNEFNLCKFVVLHQWQGAESLRPLLDKATEYIPQSSWRNTPLALKATAGLRLLSEDTAEQLLNEVGIY